jgi:phosphoglycolate phosphatase
MDRPMKLAIFDVDGTLVDSQAQILASMTAAFDAVGRALPTRETVLGIVGLSLPVAIERLVPGIAVNELDRMVGSYRSAFAGLRAVDAGIGSPLFSGTVEMFQHLSRHEDLLLGVATGKSRRGLDHLLAMHGLQDHFVTLQTADLHPSKPHPAMVEAALAEAGVSESDAVMIGDTSYDMDMGRAAGVRTIAVGWGYHPASVLEGCKPDAAVRSMDTLAGAVETLLGLPHG